VKRPCPFTLSTQQNASFLWAAILFTFALGTAAGDLTSEGLHLGYVFSALVFAALIGAIAVGFYLFKLDAILSFWIACILTRPLGHHAAICSYNPSLKAAWG
jgi:uncharacterized membrane-anchored protein